MTTLLRIHPADTVAVALRDLAAGETFDSKSSPDGQPLCLLNAIPAGHKVALSDMPTNVDVIKYGYPIGHTLRDVRRGELLDHRAIMTNLERHTNKTPTTDLPPCPSLLAPLRSARREGQGDGSASLCAYLRPDGQAGIRNDLWVIPTVGCVNSICQRIVERTKERLRPQFAILYFSHPYGCSQLGEDHENTRRILRAMVHHPNAGGILVVGLGCENNQPEAFREFCGDFDHERVRFLTCQEVEGDEVEEGVRLLTELYEHACLQQRQRLPLSKLRIGLKCGGSDGLSGITANPLLGRFSDWLCAQGGTTILTEVPEMFGAEPLLMGRAASPAVRQQIDNLINGFKQYYRDHGQPVGENPSPGNKAGGISTLEEKALGCTQKAGTSIVQGVLAYGERLPDTDSSGLHLLCAPGNDLVAATALAAAGCQLVLFTTGRGTPFSTFVPTLKVSTNSDLFQCKPHWMDFDAGTLVSTDEPMGQLLQRFVNLVLDTANGQPTRAEEASIHDIAIWKNGVTL